MTIPLFKTKIHQNSIDNVVRVLNSGWVGLGKEVEVFEQAFCEYIGCKYAVALNSGTAALQLAVELADIPRGSRIISSPLTFVATNHILLQYGLDPIFADIDPLTGNMSLDSIRKLLKIYGVGEHNTTRPRAIMAVHYGGHPIPLDFLEEIGREFKLKIIEDAAHACGAKYMGEMIGKHTRFACFSFHAVKGLPTGDGGMLCTNDVEIAEKSKKLRWFGIDKNTADRIKGGYSWQYDVDTMGYKLHMNDITATIGLGQLQHLDEDNGRRHEIYKKYQEYNLPVLSEFSHSESSHHLAVMLVKNKDQKERIIKKLSENNIQYGVHYKPNFFYPMYKNCVRENGCIKTLDFYERCISLPNHLYLSDKDIEFISLTIKEVI